MSTGYLNQMATASPAADNPLIFVGNEQNQQPINPATGIPYSTSTVTLPQFKSVAQLMQEFMALPTKAKLKVARKLALSGAFGSPNIGETLAEFVASIPPTALEAAYEELLMDTAKRTAMRQEITPDDLLRQRIQYNRSATQAAGGRAGWFGESDDEGEETQVSPLANQTVTQRYKSVDIYSPSDAKGLARAIIRRELGRDPTEEEYADFVSALQEESRENPTVTRQTSKYDENGQLASQTTRTRGGFGEAAVEQFATEQAQSMPGWAEWQAVGTYLPAVFQTLGASVPGV